VRAVSPDGVDHIFTPFSSGNTEAFVELLWPGGSVTAIDDPRGLDLLPLEAKSLSWHWEFMFTRPLFAPDDATHHELLNELAGLVDKGAIRSTMTTLLQPLDAATLREAHRLVERSSTIGKIVVARS